MAAFHQLVSDWVLIRNKHLPAYSEGGTIRERGGIFLSELSFNEADVLIGLLCQFAPALQARDIRDSLKDMDRFFKK